LADNFRKQKAILPHLLPRMVAVIKNPGAEIMKKVLIWKKLM